MTIILVTGGLGHIGSRLIRDLSCREDIDTIRILDNLSTQRYCSLFDLPTSKRYEFVEGDITNASDVKGAVKDVDTIIHLAAITDAPSTIDRPEETHLVNCKAVETTMEEAMKAGVKRFMFPSTTSVYGEAEGEVDETTTDLRPQSPYAEAKLKIEGILKKTHEERGFHTQILRMGTIFGASIGMRFHTAVNKFTYLACMGKPVTVWENALDQKRPYLGLGDSIEAFSFLEQKGEPGEIYNVLTKNYTVRQIVDTIKAFVPDLKIQLTKSPILNQKSYEVSNEKIRGLGFTFNDSITDEIGKTAELFKAIRYG